MEITTKQLRMAPGRIISQVNNGQEIIITYRGKPSAKIVPITGRQDNNLEETKNELFGIWKNRKDIKDVDQYIRKIRKGRKHVN
jgi:prevent-host-death family protein